MKVMVFGTGGVGGYLAARLGTVGDGAPRAIARGRHLEAIRSEGLRLLSPHGDLRVKVPVTDDPAEVGRCDYILLTVKSTDLAEAANRLVDIVDEHTTVVTFQNGIDAAERVGEVVGTERVVPGLAYIFSSITEPGTVAHTAGPGTFVVGERSGRATDRVRLLVEHLEAAGIDARSSTGIQQLLWRKFAFICAQAGITAASRTPIGIIRQDPVTWRLFETILDEVLGLSLRCGVDVLGSTKGELLEFASELHEESMSSLHHDLACGRDSELEHLHGAAVRLAEEVGVTLPATAAIHAVLRAWERSNAGTSA